MRSPIRDSLIVIAIIVALIFLVEAGLRLFYPQTVRTRFVGGHSLGLKEMALGHVNRPNSHTVQTGPEFSVEIKISPEGLRDEIIHHIPKPENQTRILVLGDSFTFGGANNYDQIWPVVFERNLLKDGYHVDIVKAGVCEYDTTVEYHLLERLFPKYRPDIVIFVFLPNDLFTNTPMGEPTYLESKYSGERPKSRASQIRAYLTHLHTLIALKRLLFSNDYLYTRFYLSTQRRDYFSSPMNRRLKKQVAVTEALFSKAKRYCDKRNAIFMVFSIPQQFQVIAKAHSYTLKSIDVDLLDTHFSKFAADHAFVWISALDVLSDRYRLDKQSLYFRYDGHLNPLGNTIVGDFFSKAFLHFFKKHLNQRA
ncbi:MAG: hypothetical protein JRL30_04085 [Deltaproteobacteria bacterium]|nr:hypothetical protein [Deltaproteobacteria bacterium]